MFHNPFSTNNGIKLSETLTPVKLGDPRAQLHDNPQGILVWGSRVSVHDSIAHTGVVNICTAEVFDCDRFTIHCPPSIDTPLTLFKEDGLRFTDLVRKPTVLHDAERIEEQIVACQNRYKFTENVYLVLDFDSTITNDDGHIRIGMFSHYIDVVRPYFDGVILWTHANMVHIRAKLDQSVIKRYFDHVIVLPEVKSVVKKSTGRLQRKLNEIFRNFILVDDRDENWDGMSGYIKPHVMADSDYYYRTLVNETLTMRKNI